MTNTKANNQSFNGLYGLRGCDPSTKKPPQAGGFNGLYGLRGCDLFTQPRRQEPCFNGLYGLRGCDKVISSSADGGSFQRPLWPEGLRQNLNTSGRLVRFNGLYGLRGCDIDDEELQAELFQRPLWPEGLRRIRPHKQRHIVSTAFMA